jgi:uncharacterized membrane protein YgcG
MHIARSRHLAILVFCASFVTNLTAQGSGAGAGKSTPPPPTAPPSPTAVYAQIVRVGYLEGDVRVTQGAQAEKATGTAWEEAVAGLPIETGYSLATGAGRAEIEFEDASTVYLAENSVLVLSDLKTAGGVPHTELTLLAGTATLHVRPVSGESFILKTPTDSLTTSYPGKAYLRITSYTDAIAITPQKDESYQLDAPGSVEQKSAQGQTQFFNDGRSVAPPAQSDATEFAAWDTWVANRVRQRSAAMSAVMKAAGLTAPLPGLADMNGQGAFFPCAPYGTCWDPPGDPNQQQTTGQPPAAQQQPDFSLAFNPPAVSVAPGGRVTVNLSVTNLNGFSGAVDVTPSLPAGFSCTSCSGQVAQGQPLPVLLAADGSIPEGTYIVQFTAASGTFAHQIALTVYVYTAPPPDLALVAAPVEVSSLIFPCFPGGINFLAAGDIRIGKGTYLVSLTDAPYSWVVCHAGSWIYRQNHYVWVVGRRRHHHRPIHWIKSKHAQGYVPLHPRDVTGKPPVNRKHDVYALSDKKGGQVERTQFDPKDKIESLKEPPKEFRNAYLRPLEPAGEPLIATHSMLDKQAGVTLRFNDKSQRFEVATGAAAGSGKAAEFNPVTGHNSNLHTGADGNVIARGNAGAHTSAPSGGIHTGGAAHTGAAHTGAAHTGAAHTGGAAHAGGTKAGGGHTGGGGHAGGGGGGGHAGGGGHR